MNGSFLKVTILALMYPLFLGLQAQDYTPMDFSEGATWSHTECGFKPNWGAIYKFRVSGDTTINNNIYKRVYYQSRRSEGICLDCDFTFNIDSAELFALVRQEIPKKKVYFVYPGLIDKEWLLYNFDLEYIGQPVQGFCLIFSTEPESPVASIYVYQLEVDMIDTACVDGSYVNRYFFGNGNAGNIYHRPEFWMEGLGSTHGLLVPGFGGPDWAHTLYCFSNKDGSVFYDSTAIQSCVAPSNPSCEPGMDCLTPVSVSDFTQGDPLQIYPNPVKDRLFLEFSKQVSSCRILLFDRMGREVFSRTLVSPGELETIMLTGLPQGFYYLRLFTDGFSTSRKIIVE